MKYCGIAKRLQFFLSVTCIILLTSVMKISLSFSVFRSSVMRPRIEWNGRLKGFRMISTSNPHTFSVAPMMAHTNRHFRTFWGLISKKTTLYTEMVVSDQIVQADLQNNRYLMDRLLGHNNEENPLVLQLGGNNPEMLSKASSFAQSYGYQSINLNCGCPSNTIASTNSMGAAMMYTPELTAECCAAIISATSTSTSSADTASDNEKSYHDNSYRLTEGDMEVVSSGSMNRINGDTMDRKKSQASISLSVKCRTGVDDLDSYEDLCNFINVVSSQGGVRRFQIHARKALLGNLIRF